MAKDSKKKSIRDPWKEISQHWPGNSDMAQSDDLKEAWLAHWDFRKSKLTPYGVKLVARKFEIWGLADTLTAIQSSIENGYIGIFNNSSKAQPNKHRPGDYRSGSVKSWDRTVNK